MSLVWIASRASSPPSTARSDAGLFIRGTDPTRRTTYSSLTDLPGTASLPGLCRRPGGGAVLRSTPLRQRTGCASKAATIAHRVLRDVLGRAIASPGPSAAPRSCREFTGVVAVTDRRAGRVRWLLARGGKGLEPRPGARGRRHGNTVEKRVLENWDTAGLQASNVAATW